MTNTDKLMEEVKRYYSDNFAYLSSDQPTLSILTNIARHFAEWGYLRSAEKYNEIEYNRQRAEESVPNDLEEAAKKHFKQEWNENYWTFEGDVINTFIAGAKWQKEQTEKRWLEDRDGCFWDGVEEGKKAMKEQMLKEAVEAEISVKFPVVGRSLISVIDMLKDFKYGDKVRIIIVKE